MIIHLPLRLNGSNSRSGAKIIRCQATNLFYFQAKLEDKSNWINSSLAILYLLKIPYFWFVNKDRILIPCILSLKFDLTLGPKRPTLVVKTYTKNKIK